MKTRVIQIGLSWGRPRRWARLPRTSITAFGNNAPEIEADALARTRDRFAPDAVLAIDREFGMTLVTAADTRLIKEEAETRAEDQEVRTLYAGITVRQVGVKPA